MNIHFHKYHGAGNDFILIDNRNKEISNPGSREVAMLCNRHLGIGADGLMLLERAEGFDFRMVYYNADGSESTMCGNGGRCITAFARKLGLIENKASFIAIDGPHHAAINNDGTISLDMIDVDQTEDHSDHLIMNTGSPHYVKWVDNLDETDVVRLGRSIRNQPQFQPGGINVNFVQRMKEYIRVRTYERGVEDETLSCGTGVTAAAIAFAGDSTGKFTIPVDTRGGMLEVSFYRNDEGKVKDVVLKGPTVFVFEGDIQV